MRARYVGPPNMLDYFLDVHPSEWFGWDAVVAFIAN